MVRRVTTIVDSAPMTKERVYSEMRRLGEFGDPDHPRYAEIRSAAIDALTSTNYPRVDAEQAARIFAVFRAKPALIPPAPPPRMLASDGDD